MKVAVIGRTEILYDTVEHLLRDGHQIALIVTAKEAPEYLVKAEGYEALANRIGASFLRTVDSKRIIEGVRAAGLIDIAVSMNFPGLMPKSVTDLFPLGILNAHPGDLPRYRGNACTAWAIINGETSTALCIHRMVGGELDNGEIIARERCAIDSDTTVGTLWEWIRARAPILFSQALAALERDPHYVLEHQSQRPENGLRCYPRRPEDSRIDWSESALAIDRLVRASDRPLSGAFCFLADRRMIVWNASVVEDEERFLAIPGQVTRIGEGFVEVATGAGKVRLRQVEVEGERMTPDRIVRSLRARLT